MECGKRCQPSEVVRDMQRAKGDSGVKLFHPSEYLTEQ